MPERKQRKMITLSIHTAIINMHSTGKHNIKSIAESFGFSSKTISKLIKEHELGHIFTPANIKRRNNQESNNIIHNELEQTIITTVASNNAITQKELIQKVIDTTNLAVSQPTMSRKLSKLGFTRKRLTLVPVERNTAERIEHRALFAGELARWPDTSLVYLDESGFNAHCRRAYGYSPQNMKAYTNVPANRGRNQSLLAAITSTGLLGYECISGPYNSESFINFLKAKIIFHFWQI